MNNCILMAQIIQEPQLRYTNENVAIAEMLVEFPARRDNDPPSHLKVVGWGNLAQDIHSRYHQGDRVVIEGRLKMETVEMPQGFKEKRAELIAQRIHSLGDTAEGTASSGSNGSTSGNNVVSLESRRQGVPPSTEARPAPSRPPASQPMQGRDSVPSEPPTYTPQKNYYEEDLPIEDPDDEIPF